MKKRISLVIPCYNSEKTIYDLVRLSSKCFEEHPEVDYEIILINDGSQDRTWDAIKKNRKSRSPKY